ncbi:hypothetical protein [Microbacterium amylolyticum]|uniref:Uncharacterized protein n=1 Tax=Microbacterium amylolyticum TaxID=936337 RepID=A0ABS4ZF36_9MICO|nr:hypothetical protein [Microbacterium amylolyticum]MBP2435897.1 hypothetical protein [Microbacterium amylolyticum]
MTDYSDDLDAAAQPICPACGVTAYPEGGADVCREYGWRIEWPPATHPGDGDGIVDFPG